MHKNTNKKHTKRCKKKGKRKRWTNFKFDFANRFRKKKWEKRVYSLCKANRGTQKKLFYLLLIVNIYAEGENKKKKKIWSDVKKLKKNEKKEKAKEWKDREEGGILDLGVVLIPREYILENDTRTRRGYFLLSLSLSSQNKQSIKRKNKST